jgi:putative lipoprotein
MLKRYLLSVACVLSLIACGPRMPDSNVIEGSVSYREKILLPANAIVRVQLQDVAKQDVAATQLSQVQFPAETGPPYAFELEYFPAQILPSGRYTLRATITHEDRLLFTSDTHIPAFQDGPIDIVVKRVRAPRPRPQYEE